MSNRVDHDHFTAKVERTFELAQKYLKEAKGLSSSEITRDEFPIGETGASLCENYMIHLDLNDENTLTLIKDVDSREYKVIKHGADGDIELISKCNLSDDPSVQVYVGKTASEMYQTLKSIDETNKKLSSELKNVVEVKSEMSAKKLPKARTSRPRNGRNHC